MFDLPFGFGWTSRPPVIWDTLCLHVTKLKRHVFLFESPRRYLRCYGSLLLPNQFCLGVQISKCASPTVTVFCAQHALAVLMGLLRISIHPKKLVLGQVTGAERD